MKKLGSKLKSSRGEALAETLHTAQRTGAAPDAHAYLTRLQQPAR